MKILIADDDSVIRAMLRSALTRWGHEVVEAVDGMEALNLLGSDREIQIALVDWLMPVTDGIEVCRQLREKENPPYVLLVTGKEADEDVIQGLEG